ncbi:hypothetical protein LPJ75_004473 [Coemansia sp. RSA 2598]|nr:hypothetical protein LPJ75_004473 [Coemansia sp. RSA 2598]
MRDEVELMRTVNGVLQGKEQFRNRYPTLICGGIVQLSDERGGYFDDTEDTALAALDIASNDKAHPDSYRVHKRMALKPIGQHISAVKSVDELIVVAADVMKVYMEIRNSCNILHRDISDNNVLVYRDGENNVHGVLIDFDCAIKITDEPRKATRPVMTGTVPFMSINNLTESPVCRTALDDWESIIYLLCWIGTQGVNDSDQLERREKHRLYDLPIGRWSNADARDVRDGKMVHMDSRKNFSMQIVKYFWTRKSYTPLKSLVCKLYGCLFQNKRLSSSSRGTSADFDELSDSESFNTDYANSSDSLSDKARDYLDGNLDPSIKDPFERRVFFEHEICQQLLDVISKAGEEAQKRLRESIFEP